MRLRASKRATSAVVAAAVIVAASAAPAQALSHSTNVALVPNTSGRVSNGGVLPTTGYPNGYAPTFVNVTPESIRDNATNPLTGFDTVVLNGICDIASFLANAQFKSRIESFAFTGGKVIIYDSECTSTNYSNFVFPFTTSNPGAAGATGTLTISENSTLGNGTLGDPSFLNVSLISTATDAVGDANVFTSFDQNWCAHMRATNRLGVNGPATAYAHYGTGLIIYTGLDKDFMNAGNGYGTGTGASNLNRVFLLQLLQSFAPDNLPCGVRVFGLSLSPKTAQNNVGTSHTVTAHVTSNGLAVANQQVTFTVTSGPNAGVTGTAMTDANGDAAFTYTGNGGPGTDAIRAAAVLIGTGGIRTTVTDTATKDWVGGDQPISASGTSISAGEGASFSAPVATVADPDTNAKPSEYSASIDWGDGSPLGTGTISGASGTFTVSGAHTFLEEGTYTVTVTIVDVDDPTNTATATSTATVADAALSSSCSGKAAASNPLSGPVASFSDADPNGAASDYTATIDWGDSSSSPGTVTGPTGGSFDVGGNHTYASTGSFTITVQIADVGGSTTSTTCNVMIFAFAPGGGAFVIGDLNSRVGTAVTFWGAQWWRLNSLGGGLAPAAFKGFALNPAQPACGVAWSTDPGNSAPPPLAPLPAFMAVLVTSSTSKLDMQISGDTGHIVIVQTDAGYDPSVGHPGTGTVVAQLC